MLNTLVYEAVHREIAAIGMTGYLNVTFISYQARQVIHFSDGKTRLRRLRTVAGGEVRDSMVAWLL